MQVHTPRPASPSQPQPNTPPRLWPHLSPQHQHQLAWRLADLIRRIRTSAQTTEEVPHAKP